MDSDPTADDKSLIFMHSDGQTRGSAVEQNIEYRNIRSNSESSLLAAASDHLAIYSDHGELVASSASHSDYFWGVDWSPSGDKIVTGSANGEIILWNDNAEKIAVFNY